MKREDNSHPSQGADLQSDRDLFLKLFCPLRLLVSIVVCKNRNSLKAAWGVSDATFFIIPNDQTQTDSKVSDLDLSYIAKGVLATSIRNEQIFSMDAECEDGDPVKLS